MVLSSDVQSYLEGKLGLGGADAQEGSPISYSYVEQIIINQVCIKEIVRWTSSGRTWTCSIKSSCEPHEKVMEKRDWDEDEVKSYSIVH